jgi:hypothetical protein
MQVGQGVIISHATCFGTMLLLPEARVHVPGRRPRDVLSDSYCFDNSRDITRISIMMSVSLLKSAHACDDEATP